MTGPEEFLGIKYATMVAGFCGTLWSLSFTPKLNAWRMVVFVAGGMVASIYIPTLLIDYGWFTAKSEGSIAFLIGLLANQVMPGLMSFAKKKSESPDSITIPKKKGDDTQ
jgi:predicted membrane channel-forming protein YqfA (hemolysin III family)